MRVYVGARTNQFEKVQRIHTAVRRLGHTITFDWTEFVDEGELAGNDERRVDTKRECAENDFLGVSSCELFIAVIDGDEPVGTFVEFGIALALYKECWLIGDPHRDSIFFYMPQVTTRFPSVTDFLNKAPRHLERIT